MTLVVYHGTSLRNLKRIWNDDYDFGHLHSEARRFVLDYYPEIRSRFGPKVYDIADALDKLGGVDAGSCVTSLEHFLSGKESDGFAFGDFYATTQLFTAYRYAWRGPEILDVLRGLNLLVREYSPRFNQIGIEYTILEDEWSSVHDPVVIELVVDDLSRLRHYDGRIIEPAETDSLSENEFTQLSVRVAGFSKSDISGIYDVRNLGNPYLSMDPSLFLPKFRWIAENDLDSFLQNAEGMC